MSIYLKSCRACIVFSTCLRTVRGCLDLSLVVVYHVCLSFFRVLHDVLMVVWTCVEDTNGETGGREDVIRRNG